MRFDFNSRFVKQVSKLASGTALAQIINIVTLPLLTRLYSPSDFGVFAVFLASVAILTSISTLKYENSILDAGNNELAKKCTQLTAASCVLVLVPLIVVMSFLYKYNVNIFGLDFIMLLCVGLAIIATNIFTSLYYWCNRTEKYGYMTKGRIYAAVSAALVSISIGLSPIESVNGLVIGALVGMFCNALYLIIKVNFSIASLAQTSIKDLIYLSISLKRFPIYLVPSTLLDRVASQVHIFVFSNFFGNSVAGAMGVYNRVIGLPVSIIGNAIGDVFKREASELFRKEKSCRKLFIKTAITLFIIGLPITITLFFFAPTIFVFVLGNEWLQAGEIASFLAINFLFAFVVSPLAGLLYLKQNQKYDFAIQVLLITTLGSGMYFAVLRSSLEIALYSYALSFILKYVVQFFACYRLAK
ncbi:oligosaccharide flippase family protein [Glaciecola sp. XM2]|uniref:lipopolysaccharide biosynthesis protein n=1 Tax=Glaciecola sp. XM2 TaxID=1914931 RepID=UPI001BDEED08|nr:oligosaccharide flippase family protein [Glaciecola sp. XM2]MBT1450698.1 oligosaccharide flippase family protein [Glaciecola sp. XM2]